MRTNNNTTQEVIIIIKKKKAVGSLPIIKKSQITIKKNQSNCNVASCKERIALT